MSFINKSVNYSQSASLKNKILYPLLSLYNNFVLYNNSNDSILDKDITTGLSTDYLVPNNNKKYYLLVTLKNKLENVKENYNIFYFFPDETLIESVKDNNILKNTISDFYLESNNKFTDEYLFEGYLYKQDDHKYEYLLTDILIKNSKVIDLNYELRYALLNEIILSIPTGSLKELNNHMTINIHHIFNSLNQNLVKIFKNNFKFKNELCCIEKIEQNVIKKQRIFEKIIHEDSFKLIEIGKYIDVYNVYNYNTNNYEGILYVKGLKESKYLINLFKNTKNSKIRLKCKFNTNFTKWEPNLQ